MGSFIVRTVNGKQANYEQFNVDFSSRKHFSTN